jgi:hypothetical protein
VISVILNLIGGLFQVAGKIFDWLYAKQLVDAGKTSQQIADLKAQIDAAHKALQARLAVERERELNPNGVRDDDGFKRPPGQ